MVSRARIATFLLSFLLTAASTYAQVSQPASQVSPDITALQGKVLTAQGRPASGIHIEVEDATTAVPLSSTYTQRDGTFELYNIPKGNYEVIADSLSSEASGEVSVQPGQPEVELRFPANREGAMSPDAVISVARMMVPPSAQKMYGKAYRAFQKGKYDIAEKELDGALQIDPQFAAAITLRGTLALNHGDTATARQLFEKAIQTDPSESAAYIALAAIYNHEGHFDNAMLASQKGLSLAPRTWQAYLEMAKASIAKSMYQSGLKFLRQAERLGGSSYAEVHLVKAYALVPLKLYKDAKYELQASLAHQRQGQVAEQAQSMLAQLDVLETAQLGPTH